MAKTAPRSNGKLPPAALRRPFADAGVKAAFDAYPTATRRSLIQLRALILATAEDLDHVSPIVKTLKWNQPAYLPAKRRIGSTIRIDALNSSPMHYALYFRCQTALVARFRQLYPDLLAFEANRALHFCDDDEFPRDAVRHCIAMALTYHLKPLKI